ncbi:hypothetical protein NITLEN_90121 [Nitrospira lenta]|uniref:Uncharacterized protein n=1 Tax=Nitrospira lenta TaxID=1436998 RepID=A0A330LCZ2_9BACT|nr:hypothetical protein NITLEN_90121 [Nitrospira lenta]
MRQLESRSEDLIFSLAYGDPWFRVQRAIGLIPSEGPGIVRRSLVLALVMWLPIAIWVLIWRRAFPRESESPVLRHVRVYVGCLVSIPLFVVVDIAGHLLPQRLMAYFVSCNLVDAMPCRLWRRSGTKRGAHSWISQALYSQLG